MRGELRGGRRKMAGDGGAGEASIFLHTGRLPRYISHPSKIATTGILRQLPGMQLLVRQRSARSVVALSASNFPPSPLTLV